MWAVQKITGQAKKPGHQQHTSLKSSINCGAFARRHKFVFFLFKNKNNAMFPDTDLNNFSSVSVRGLVGSRLVGSASFTHLIRWDLG